jgi:hypothetical protein
MERGRMDKRHNRPKQRFKQLRARKRRQFRWGTNRNEDTHPSSSGWPLERWSSHSQIAM